MNSKDRKSIRKEPNPKKDFYGIIGGLVFLIIGFVCTVTIVPRLLFSLFYVIEKSTATIRESIKTSLELSQKNYWQIIALFCCTFLINYLTGIYLKPILSQFVILMESTQLVIEISLFMILYKIASNDSNVK